MESLAVLISGGLDSAILLGDALRRQSTIYPIYIRCGLHWETVELAWLRRYLDAVRCSGLKQLTILDQPVADLYGPHWSVTGQNIPDADSPDEAVFLPGRNVLLLTKALLWCHLHNVPALALGSLGTNSFADASPSFFKAVTDLVNESIGGSVALRVPFGALTKREVMKLGAGLPLEYAFSCINPKGELHCGACNKCAERRRAFQEAKMIDPTSYAASH